MSLDLNKLKNKLDEALSNETSETLTKFLTDKRMNNNKQSTKLYTTDQVIDIFEKYGNMSAINARNIIDLSESIELPSDEEINKRKGFEYPANQQDAFEEGAKWMRNKIQGGNNEY